MQRVLVVDDEDGIRAFICKVLEGQGLGVTEAADGHEAEARLERESFHLMITDLRMPRVDGMTLLRKARAEQPEMEVVVLTAHATVDTAVEAMKLGAFDYLQKPLSGPDELRLVVSRALERRRLREEGQRTRLRSDELETVVARDRAMLAIVEQVRRVAATDATVLLLGESGTGKEVLARALHRWSGRSAGPLVAVNCGALSEALLESELFGHEKGAFTGASASQRGRFELADGGTLFLDEIAELEPRLQVKLLRVLEERSFERVGGSRTIQVDIRLVAATNRNLRDELQSGRLREDLYHRLSVFPIQIPPLRERPSDIVPLAQHLLDRLSRQLGRDGLSLDETARQRLCGYDWPGNVRELGNVLERAAILADTGVLSAEDLFGLDAMPVRAQPASEGALDGTLQQLEEQAIRRALAATGGHRKKAAAKLGIGLRTLYEKIKQYGLD